MNSSRYPYAVQSWHSRTAVPGTGGMSTQAMVMRAPIPPQFLLEGVFSSPSTLIPGGEEEGINNPFSTRFYTGMELPPRLHVLARNKTIGVAEEAATPFGTPFPMQEAGTPDETPITVSKLTEIPFYKLAKVLKDKKFSILRVTESAPVFNPRTSPAPAYFLNVCDLLSKVQERLMETPNNGVSYGSGQWTQAEVLRYVNDRLNHFIEHTGIIRKLHYAFVQETVHTYDLPTDLLEVNRVVLNVNGTVTYLHRIDKFALDAGTPGWESQTGPPVMFLEEPLEYHKLRIHPVPASVDVGLLEIVYTPSFNISNAMCEALPIPAPFEPYIAWGVIADMLKREGEMFDPERADYAEKRYEEGIQLAMLMRGDG